MHYGTSSVRTGAIGHSQSSWLATTVTRPGVLSFQWKVPSEANYDFLSVSIDGVKKLATSGEADWSRQALSIAAGPHTVRWQYTKDQAGIGGRDAGWVDHVAYVPETAASDMMGVFNWAAFAYPQFFKGPFVPGSYKDATGSYTYRHYPDTGNYLGLRHDGQVVVHNGRDWILQAVGALREYLMSANAAGF